MKKIAILLMFVLINISYSIDWYNFQETSDDKGGSSKPIAAYNVAYVTCDGLGCGLNCYGGGETQCTWDDADYSCDCDFDDSFSQEMFDYAHHQMDSNNTTGLHVDHIMPITGTKYYRSVSWSEDTSGIRIINYTLGVD